MSAGKGDRPRAVNGDIYRRNYDSIFSEDGKNFDYPEGSKSKEQRISALIYAEQMMKCESNPSLGQMNSPATITIKASSWARVVRERDEAREQNEEQARLLAMSADREEKLRTDLMLARKLAESAMLKKL